MADQNSAYRNMLIQISDLIQESELKNMKFRCSDIIKTKEREKIVSVLDLWNALEQRDRLGPNNLDLLKDILSSCMAGKREALNVVLGYERLYSTNGHNTNYTQQPAPHVAARIPPPQVVYVVQDGLRQRMPKPRYEGPDLKREITFLSNNLGRDWKFYVRALGVSEDEIDNIMGEHRQVREQIFQCLLAWQLVEQQNASRMKLVSALRDSSVQREDLACEMEKNLY